MTGVLVRVVAPHFVAGFIVENDHCIRAAPIIKWFVGKPSSEIRAQCAKRDWRAHVVKDAA